VNEDQRGEDLGGEKAKRGSDGSPPRKTGLPYTDPTGAKTLEVEPVASPDASPGTTISNGKKGTRDREVHRATAGGKPLKVENPRALPARNKAGRVADGTKRQEVAKA